MQAKKNIGNARAASTVIEAPVFFLLILCFSAGYGICFDIKNSFRSDFCDMLIHL